MSKKKKGKPTVRAEPAAGSTAAWLCSVDAYDVLTARGYTSLAENPEICAGVDAIARLVGSMTIHLMENTAKGDIRVQNQLSRKIDIEPNGYMTRSNFIHWIVKTLFLGGNGNAVVWPQTKGGILQDLHPIPPCMVSFRQDGWGYKIIINAEEYDPQQLLHFVLNPDENQPWRGTGYRVALADVAHNLKQAAATEKGFMESKWKPSVIIKVDGLTEEFASKKGRAKLLSDYIDTDQTGTPWLIPADQFEVTQVKPLSLADLAISDVIQLDKRTVAAILSVPPFVLGVGDFDRDAWNNFINSRLMPIAQMIQQVLTKGLLYKPEWYFRFNARSLYGYDLKDLATIADAQYVRGIMDGNEVRDWIGLPPRDGLDELIILENYIPRGMIGDQSKLNGDE